MEQLMKKRILLYSTLMSICLSFVLSLFGTATSGHFTIPGFIISFILSTIISLIIGFIVPMKKINMSINSRFKFPASFLLIGLISDIIYTPFITAVMIALAAKNAPVPFSLLFVSALTKSFLVGYVAILLFQYLFSGLIQPPKNMGTPESAD